MSKVFIDCGGYNGCSVTYFRENYDPNYEYTVYTFEPNEVYFECYSNFEKHVLVKKAVWIADTKLPFYLDWGDGDGSSLMREKTTGNLDKDKPVMVHCVDLSSWIRRKFSKDDEIVLKLDIEGAEYRVIKKMFNDGTINMIDKFFIEWHWKKIKMSEKAHDKVASLVKKPILEWPAQLEYIKNTEHRVNLMKERRQANDEKKRQKELKIEEEKLLKNNGK
jgi:FkbM family methyltransferase